jgi:hypothetical protein
MCALAWTVTVRPGQALRVRLASRPGTSKQHPLLPGAVAIAGLSALVD